MTAPRSIEIHILGRPFRVACTLEQEPALLAAARLLDEKMREIRDAGKVVGIERIAIMAGLNLAHEALKNCSAENAATPAAVATLTRCHTLVDAMLDDRAVPPAAPA